MSIFEDKKYSEMDWLAQAVEPIISSLNEKLSSFPDEFELTYSDINHLLPKIYNDLSIRMDDILSHVIRKNMPHIDNEKIEPQILKAYDLEKIGNPVLDMDKRTLEGGKIIVVKTIDCFDEKTLLSFMGLEGLSELSRLHHRTVDVARANEIIELIGGHDSLLKVKSIDKKCNGIYSAMTTIMTKNQWNIRNVELSNKVVQWVYLYLRDGNLAALTNFCKFKVMTHEGNPIYSVQEEPV